MNILLLEDTFILRDQISEYFLLLGHNVTTCSDGNEFFNINNLHEFDLFLLDLNVPFFSGIEILVFLNNEKIEAPKMVITASSDILSMKDSFKYGCCEYIKKPFSLEELEVRVSRFFATDSNLVELPNMYTFDKEKNQLIFNNEEVKLTKIHKNIIRFLISNTNRTCSANEIIEYISPDKLIDVNTLSSHMKNIRQATTPEIIKTIRGEGYTINIIKNM